MKSTGKIGLLMMAVTIIFSAAAKDCSDGDRDYCCIDFTEELTGAEASYTMIYFKTQTQGILTE